MGRLKAIKVQLEYPGTTGRGHIESLPQVKSAHKVTKHMLAHIEDRIHHRHCS